jgi:hypothetical protein
MVRHPPLFHIMRTTIILLGLLLVATVHAQWSISTACTGVDDRYAERTLLGGIAAVEFRTRHLPAFGCRVGITAVPQHTEAHQLWSTDLENPARHWLASSSEERVSLLGLSLDLKLPMTDTTCIGGLYRGVYTTFGVGFTNYWRAAHFRQENKFGEVAEVDRSSSTLAFMLRAGFGGEWNFTWGCPFAEAQLGIGGKGISTSVGAVLGFRYVFAAASRTPSS